MAEIAVQEFIRPGVPNRSCTPLPGGKFLIYDPVNHRAEFSILQGDKVKTFAARLTPQRGHQMRFRWNNVTQDAGFMIDGVEVPLTSTQDARTAPNPDCRF